MKLMSLDNIYYELSFNHDDDYYIALAEKEVLFVPVLVDFMVDNSSNRKWAQLIFEKISKTNPDLVYPYFNNIMALIEKNRKFHSWSLWKIISNIVTRDYLNRWEFAEPLYIKSLSSDNLIEFSVACECAENIIKSKPDRSDKIFEILKSVDSRTFIVNGKASPTGGLIAKEKVEQLINKLLDCE